MRIDDQSRDFASTVEVASAMAATTVHSNDALLRATFKLIEVGIDTYMLVSAKHANYAVDVADLNGARTLVLRDYRSFYMESSTAAFLTFRFVSTGSTISVTADARHVYNATTRAFIADPSWTALNVAVQTGRAVLTADQGTPFTAFALYMPTLSLDIPFDFNPTRVARVSNGEYAATWDGTDRIEATIRDVAEAYRAQVSAAGPDGATSAAAETMLAEIESTLAAEGAALRYPAALYKTVRASLLARKVEVSDVYNAPIGSRTVPYVFFTNEQGSDGRHHPFMVIASYGLTEGMNHLWDVPRPPGDGAPGTTYAEQQVTRSAGRQAYFAKIPLRDYGEVETLTENSMVNDLASDAPGSVQRDHYNYASISATGIAVDGVVVYPILNNTLSITAAAGELSSVGIHSGRGLGVHYHADAHSATQSGLNLYNESDYAGRAHPPLITMGFDGVSGYGKYLDGDTTSHGSTTALDAWGGHGHGDYDYHYHAETAQRTAEIKGPNGGSVEYVAHMLPSRGAWRGRINDIPDFWDRDAPAYGGQPGIYQGITKR